jgi:hypothetical protein
MRSAFHPHFGISNRADCMLHEIFFILSQMPASIHDARRRRENRFPSPLFRADSHVHFTPKSKKRCSERHIFNSAGKGQARPKLRETHQRAHISGSCCRKQSLGGVFDP